MDEEEPLLGVCSIRLNNKKEKRVLDRVMRSMPPEFKKMLPHPRSGMLVETLTPIGILWLAEQVGGKYRDQVHAAIKKQKEWLEEREQLLAKINSHASRLPPKMKMRESSFQALAALCRQRLLQIKTAANKRKRKPYC